MAPPSPRRSSRARPIASQSQQSSVSSSTSGRLERSTRSVNKPSSGKSTPSASLSSEPLDDLDDTLLGRRRKRGQDDESDRPLSDNMNIVLGSEDLQDEEDEAVRCICGSEDYPGPPPADAPEADFFLAHELTEDVTGFYVQCDICKVWQHGACVGIFSAEASPDEYFCEQCRQEYHKILTANTGQRYSKYLPLQPVSRATSIATSVAKDGTKSPKGNGKTRSDSAAARAAAKRRSTMNSRDAAYDDEQLRRAIEASKEETATEGGEDSLRRQKRGRSDSEGDISQVKRQRTSSRSASPPVEHAEIPSRHESDDESAIRNESRKPRSGRIQHEKEEKEDKERARQEAASKRKGRAERRRVDDSDLSEEHSLAAAKATVAKSVEPPTVVEPPPPVTQPTPGTPPAIQTATGPSHKKGARSNHKKTKGKNQYTKDREPGDTEESPARSMSRDIQKTMDEPAATSHSKPTPSDHIKPTSKSKSAMTTKMSMTDMRRRVGAIMDFISRTQVDLAAEATPPHSGASSTGQQTPQKSSPAQTNGFAENQPDVNVANGITPGSPDGKDFKELNCMEMMDVLTRDMVKWQNQFA